MAPSREIIDLSSDEDDRWGNRGNRSLYKYDTVDKKQSIKSTAVKKELDEDCVILDRDPDQPVKADNDRGKGSDELLIVAEKGQVACRDYPHARRLCARFPFSTSPHEKHCDLCHCYVCDTRAPCVYWGTGMSNRDHCHSTDKEETWRVLRKLAQLLASKHPATTLLDAPPVLPTITRSQPINNEERGILLGPRNLSLDQLIVQADRLTGTVKWYDNQREYGFIIPDNGSEDLFVHKSSIKVEGYPSLVQGKLVEFQTEIGDDGRKKAINVSGPGGSLFRGRSNTSACYKCGETGHLMRNCSGHLARSCSYTERGSDSGGSGANSSDTYEFFTCGRTGHSALDRPTLHADRLTGIVKWFDSRRGFGFIVPDSGSEYLFFHKYSVRSEGYRSLAEGESVEFQIEIKDDGREAINVSGPGGSFVRGRTDISKCYTCGEMGHLARNCSSSECFKCGGTGHSARNCSFSGCYDCGGIGHFARNCPYTQSGSGGDGSAGYSSGTFESHTCGETGHLGLDRLTVQADRLTGTVMRYDRQRGFGYITPDDGSEDLFFHKSSIKSKGYPGLVEGQLVEFQIEIGDGRRKKAIDVSVPGGHRDTSKCYKCGETGHVAWNCSSLKCYNCGETGHFARNCSYTQSGGDGGGSGDDNSHTFKSYTCAETRHLARGCDYKGSGGTIYNGNDVSECYNHGRNAYLT